jgi:hypothetical protein
MHMNYAQAMRWINDADTPALLKAAARIKQAAILTQYGGLIAMQDEPVRHAAMVIAFVDACNEICVAHAA